MISSIADINEKLRIMKGSFSSVDILFYSEHNLQNTNLSYKKTFRADKLNKHGLLMPKVARTLLGDPGITYITMSFLDYQGKEVGLVS